MMPRMASQRRARAGRTSKALAMHDFHTSLQDFGKTMATGFANLLNTSSTPISIMPMKKFSGRLLAVIAVGIVCVLPVLASAQTFKAGADVELQERDAPTDAGSDNEQLNARFSAHPHDI